MSESKSLESNFVFQQTFLDAALMFPGKDSEKFLQILINYGLTGEEPDFSIMSARSQLAASISFVQIRKRIDASKRRYSAAVENGKRGGRPKKGENDAKKTSSKTSAKTSNGEPENQSEKQTQNLNINSNDNTLGNYHYLKGTVAPSGEPNDSPTSPVPKLEPYTAEQAIADIKAKAAAREERERAEAAERERIREEQFQAARAERERKIQEAKAMLLKAKEAEVSAG